MYRNQALDRPECGRAASATNSDEQLFIQANGSLVLVFDNASGMRNDISDALCRLATGGGIAKRRLYTDEDVHLLYLCCAFVINGIGEFAHRPDLIERAVLLSLPAMPDGSRRTEKSILQEFNTSLPSWLGNLYDIVAEALRNEDTVIPPVNIRMTDAASWIKAAEPATGFPAGTLLSAIKQSQLNSVINRILENSLVLALEAVIANAVLLRGKLHAGRFAQVSDNLLRRCRIAGSFGDLP